MSIIGSLFRRWFIYTDDFGIDYRVQLAESIGDAGGLERTTDQQMQPMYVTLHLRHVRIRSLEAETNGRKSYKDIPVQKSSTLWQGPLGQRILIAGSEFETVKKVDEKEYNRKGSTAARRQIKELEAQKAKLKI